MTSAAALVETLAGIAARFSPEARADKLRVLGRLAEREIRRPTELARFHETLCFLRAYPDDAAVLAAVTRALDGCAARVRRLAPAARARLHDSGIAGTSLDYPFGLPMTRWLLQRFPRDVDVLWRKFAGGERLEEALALLVTHPEAEAFTEGGLGWRTWLAIERGERRTSDLAILVQLFDRAPLPEEARDWLFESLSLPIVWRLRGSTGSRTQAAMPWPRPSLQTTSLRRDDLDFVGEVTRPLAGAQRAPPALAAALVEVARAAMATRARELYVFSYPNVADVLVADADRGLRIALFGLPPDRQLPLEVYYAFLVLKNGVPVGYGAAWALFGTLELAFNVFEAFRQGESAYLLSQVLRVYRRTLGVRSVVVDRYQIGHDNPEALRAGAFYFYTRLGFRPLDATVRKLADEERERIARDRAYRSPLAVLRRLARSSLVLTLDGDDEDFPPRVTGARIAALVTQRIAAEFEGNRPAATRATAARMGATLGARRRTAWPREERLAFERLALVAALVPDLERWPAADRRRLVALMRARGAPDQRRYTRLLGEHRRWRASLEQLGEGLRPPSDAALPPPRAGERGQSPRSNGGYIQDAPEGEWRGA